MSIIQRSKKIIYCKNLENARVFRLLHNFLLFLLFFKKGVDFVPATGLMLSVTAGGLQSCNIQSALPALATDIVLLHRSGKRGAPERKG